MASKVREFFFYLIMFYWNMILNILQSKSWWYCSFYFFFVFNLSAWMLWKLLKQNLQCLLSYVLDLEKLFNCIFIVAVSKPVTMSSSSRAPSNAVDNIIDCRSFNLLAHTYHDFQPWLKIDLQAMHDVIKVTIVNRFDCCGIYLKYLYFNII